ncbi:MAG: choice-of-anchor B family protein [Caldilineaceae bacterium]
MNQPKLLPPFVVALLVSSVLGLTAYGLLRPAFAHELGPLAPPQLPACYAAAATCESPLASRHLHPETVTNTRPLDGKSWLPLDTNLLTTADLRSANRQPLFDIPCVDGFADVFPCDQVDLLAFLPHTLIGGDTNNDMWGWTDPVTGKEYALVGARDGVVFVDISTPTAPRYLGKLPTHATRSSWRDLKVYQDHLFVVADLNQGHGLQVFDLTQLRTLTTTTTTTATVRFHETTHYDAFSDAHNLAINEESGYAYAVGGETCNSGLHMINLQEVTAPTNAGCYTADGYIHDTQCVLYRGPDAAYQGRELCFNSSVSQFTIVDVTDKTAPTRIAAIAVEGNIYMHQGWLTPDQHYFLLDDEMDEWFGQHNTRTYIFDVSDIDAPRFINAYTAALPSVDHNLYISGTYAYEANYTTGLRMLDIKDIGQGRLTEAAFFDTYPENDDAVSAGAWTAYPFYQSGVVAISTLDRGLFLVRPKLRPDVLITNRSTAIALCSTTASSSQFAVPFNLQARNQYTQSVRLRTAQLPTGATAHFTPAQVDLDTATQATSTLTVDMAALAGGLYTLTVEAVGADEVVLDQATVTLHLSATPVVMPILQTPAMITVTQVTNIPFTWSSDSNATDYLVKIAADPAFTTIAYTATVNSAAFTLPQPLAYDQTYYWRVQPYNGCGAGESSAVGQFHTPNAVFLPLVER